MSWSPWATAATAAQSTQNSGSVPSASSEPAAAIAAGVPFGGGMAPPTSYTPAQFAALSPEQQYALQQNWQQWQTYHQQYAQWHAQYGEQYQREMQAKLGMVAPSIPFVPPMPPYAAPVPPATPLSYAIPPPPPTQAPTAVNPPSISAIAAQPPPPPPPPEDTANSQIAKASMPQFFNQNHEKSSQQFNQSQQQPPPLFNKNQIQQAHSQKMPFNQSQNPDYLKNPQQQQQQKGYNSNESPRMQNNDSRNFNSERRNYNDSNRHKYNDHYNRNSGDRSGFDTDNRNRHPWQSNQQPFGNQQQHPQPHQMQQEQPFGTQNIEPEIEKDSSQNKLPSNDEKTPEDRLFDEQFQKWEEEFSNWRRQNANHPDKKGYIEYETKFLETRRKLLERREIVKKRNLERLLNERQEGETQKNMKSEISLKSEQVKEENHNQGITRNEPLESSDVPPLVQNIDQQQKEVPTEAAGEVISAEQPEEVVEFLKTSNNDGGIPGLDLVTTLEQNINDAFEDVTEVIDLEADQKGDQPDRKTKAADLNITNVNVLQTPTHLTSAPVTSAPMHPYFRKEIPSLMSQKFEKPSLSPSPPPMLQNTNSNGAASDCQTESFGQFLDSNLNKPVEENSLSNHSGNHANSDASDKGSIPPVVAELANALSDPNVLALLTAAMGGQAGGGNFGNPGGPLVSPWMAGKAPFQDKNHAFRDNAPGCNFNDFGGNQNNSRDFRGGPSGGNKWQDNNRNNNPSWGNRNMNNNRGNYNMWPNRQNRPDDNRRGGYQNWFNRDRDGRRNNRWQQDDTDARNDIERNIGSTDVINERADIMEQRGDKFNPFKDREDRSGGQINSIENNRGRNRNRNNESNYNDNDGLQHVNRDRSRSSGRSGYFDSSIRQDDNSSMGSTIRNPFKIESNIFDKPSDSQQSGNDGFFQPAHVIDYQNRPLGGVSSNSDILFPTKVVDYGHKPSAGVNECNDGNQGVNDFLPMKTIDYGHSSVTNDIEKNNQGKNTAFQGGGRGRNRNRFRNKKKSTVLKNDQHFPRVSSYENDIIPQSPGWPTTYNQENTEQTIQSSVENEIGVNPNYSEPVEPAAATECSENFEELSEDDNDFDDIKSSRVSDFDQTSTIPTPLSEENNIASVFPIKHSSPPKQIKKVISLKFPTMENNNTITIDEILLKPGRYSRPKNIVIILRGPPGSGKSYVAKLIKEKEVEMGGSAPRLLSIDDYFMTEIDAEEMCPNTGKKMKKEDIVYKYEKDMESNYMQCLIKAFKRTVKDHLFDFVIVDCVNESLRSFTEFYNNAKEANFTPYTIDLLCDLETCLSRNVHNRSEEDIQQILDSWKPTPAHYIKLDVTSLLQNESIPEIEMEDISDTEDGGDKQSGSETELGDDFEKTGFFLKSKWDTDCDEKKLARLDGISKPLQRSQTLEDYLQMDGWEPPTSSSNNKKRVRWADIEEKRAQDKMRAIGFVVGHTNWDRMMDPTGGRAALTKTKYIEKINKRR